jgi:dUTP pyrophosphatase
MECPELMKDDFVRVRVKLLTEEGQLPKAAKDGDVAFDLFSSVDYDLEPGTRYAVPTGIAIELPAGYEGQVRPRSGLALRNGITTLNTPGTIDTGYRGEVKVILINHGDVVFHVSKGDRIAQLAIRKVQFTEVDSLGSSDRGEDGFGSTGL